MKEREGVSGSHTNLHPGPIRNYDETVEKLPRTKNFTIARESLKTLDNKKNQLQYNLSAPAQQNTRRGGWSDPELTSWREGPTKERPNKNQKPKTYTEPT